MVVDSCTKLRVNFSLCEQVLSEPVLLFLRQLESFRGSGVFMRFVELRVTVAWALESLQSEFVSESYVQNSEISTGCHENQ